MSMAVVGMIAGMALGFAGYFGGFGAFLLVAALGAVGFVAGRFLEGDLEAGRLLPTRATNGGGDVGERWGHGTPRSAVHSPTPRARGDPDRRPGRREDRRTGGARGGRGTAQGRRPAVRRRRRPPSGRGRDTRRRRPGPRPPRTRLPLRHRRPLRAPCVGMSWNG